MKSIIDQDLYTLTVGQAINECFPHAVAKYQFTNRKGTKFTKAFLDDFNRSIEGCADLSLTPDERKFLETEHPQLKPQYIEWLQNYRFDPSEVEADVSEGDLYMEVNGNWGRTIHWEVPCLMETSESYYKTVDTNWSEEGQEKLFCNKADRLDANEVYYSDFGTRRRRSYASQDRIVRLGKNYLFFMGTSNVHLAHKHKVKAKGTQSHQWVMGNAALESLRYANRYAMRNWLKVYHGEVGTVLPDTYGLTAFLNDFDTELARVYDGVRHDSGPRTIFTDRVVAHYRSMGINQTSKILTFSDALNVDSAIDITKYCRTKNILSNCGIGTHFTNDYLGSPPLNIVMKLRSIKRTPTSPEIQVVKLSDEHGKETGEENAVKEAKWVFYGEAFN